MLSTKSYLTFKLENEMFFAEIDKISSILTYQDVTAVPDTPEYFAGVTNWRGEMLPVFDLRILLGLKSTPLHNRILFLVTEISTPEGIVKVAFVIDYAMNVVDIDASEIQPLPSITGKVNTDYVDGIYYRNKAGYLLINLEALILNELKEDLSEVTNIMV